MSKLVLNPRRLLKYHLDVKIIIVAVLYYVSARLGYFLAFHDTTTLPTWPPSGIAFAMIILLGRSSWPGITIGALVANLMAYWNTHTMPSDTVISISCFIAIGQTMETLAGNFFIKHWIQDDYPFRNTRSAFRFLFVTLMMCLVGASVTTLSLYFNDVIDSRIYGTAFSLWVGNVVGILLFTPFLLATARRYTVKFSSRKAGEIGVFILGGALVFLLMQIGFLEETIRRALPFLVLPFLLWLAFRFELVVAITGVLVASLFAIYLTVNNTGPFLLSESYSSMLLLQIFIGVTSITTIILSATVKERVVVQRELEVFNENLESMVAARTRELHDEVETRRRAEEKIQRTNKELSKRNSELDNFVYSVSHDLRAPIASVLGLINLAKKDKDLIMKDTYLDMINNSALQQDNFIKEILDQSRNSRLEIKREEIHFERLVNDTFNQLKFATSTDEAKVLQKEIHVTQTGAFFCDQWRLKVIFNNIISNSIRYRNGCEPLIKIDVMVNSETARLSIQDNGKGIAKEHLAHIFKMFYRATDDGAGSGLGLYIVKEAVDKLGGSIEIHSEEEKGTLVLMEIPSMVSESILSSVHS